MPRSKKTPTPPEQFPQKFAEALIHVFSQRELTDGLARWAESEPSHFYRLVAGLMPQQIAVFSGNQDRITDPQDMRAVATRLAFVLASAANERQEVDVDPISPPLSITPVQAEPSRAQPEPIQGEEYALLEPQPGPAELVRDELGVRASRESDKAVEFQQTRRATHAIARCMLGRRKSLY